MLGQYYIITTMRCVLCGGRLSADMNGPILPVKPHCDATLACQSDPRAPQHYTGKRQRDACASVRPFQDARIQRLNKNRHQFPTKSSRHAAECPTAIPHCVVNS
jgi:hypothetical protein